MAALGGELENKKSVLKAAKEEVHEMSLRIQYNMDKRNGLCIRCVQKTFLSVYCCYFQPLCAAWGVFLFNVGLTICLIPLLLMMMQQNPGEQNPIARAGFCW